MKTSGLEQIAAVLGRTPRVRAMARVAAVRADHVVLDGIPRGLAPGDAVAFSLAPDPRRGEVVAVEDGRAQAVIEGPLEGLSVDCPAVHLGPVRIAPDDSWVGRTIDPLGRPLDGRPLTQGAQARGLLAAPPQATARRGLGARLATGLHALNTFLAVARGQRIGLFAGPGVGKSNLLGALAGHLDADVVVVALVGERGREVGAFTRQILGPKALSRSVIVAATSDQPALMRRRAALAAMAVAEHFRDAGRHVLLVVDSVTRLAEAHREIAGAAGEAPVMRGFPPSVVPLLAGLAERAGPGADGQGDITAVFSVLVAGSDMDEPVADTLRGLLDGHVVLSRDIAERGRFPAIDVLQSVSRALPDAATDAENEVLARARNLLGLYQNSEIMIRSGLYRKGSDPALDQAVAVFPELDRFIAGRSTGGVEESFEVLRACLAGADGGDAGGDPED